MVENLHNEIQKLPFDKIYSPRVDASLFIVINRFMTYPKKNYYFLPFDTFRNGKVF